MPDDFPLAIYNYHKRDGGDVLVPLTVIDENVAKRQGYELRKVFACRSAMELSIGYNTAMILRWTHDEKGLLSRLKDILN